MKEGHGNTAGVSRDNTIRRRGERCWESGFSGLDCG